jgi:hypothetical protein
MRKGSGVALIVGMAIALVVSGGLAVTFGAISASARQPVVRQLHLLSTVRAMEAPSTDSHQSPFQQTSQQGSAVAEWEIQSTRRISIPFGIATPLMLRDLGRSVLVAGHGGCTAAQQVTVQVTLTQTATAALATGQTEEVCTGELQSWSSIAVDTTGVRLVAEPAQVCGVAETREGDSLTDRFAWCRDVDLVYGLYLPLALYE